MKWQPDSSIPRPSVLLASLAVLVHTTLHMAPTHAFTSCLPASLSCQPALARHSDIHMVFGRRAAVRQRRAACLAGPLQATPLPETQAGTPPTTPPKKLKFGETTKRSLVKAIGWRLTAAVITLISGLLFAGNLKTAATIVGSDFATKSVTMFVGERLWNKVKWGQGEGGDSIKRSAGKALLWRAFAAANTLVCSAILMKGDFTAASKIAGLDTVVKTGLFFVNERIWNNIEWGKEYDVDYVI